MELTKRFTPNDLCRILGCSKSSILYWEAQGLIPKARRSVNIMRSRYWNEDDAKAIADYRYFRQTVRGTA